MLATRALPEFPQGPGSAQKRAKSLAALPPATLILGIDPGLHRTGYGLIDLSSPEDSWAHKINREPQDQERHRQSLPRVVEAGVITAKPTQTMPERLRDLHQGLVEILQEYAPHVVVIEDLFSTYAHPRSALLMAHARGVLILAAGQASIPVHTFTPNEVKQAVSGNGHAGKAAVQAAVRTHLRLQSELKPPDVADALAIALCFTLRQNLNQIRQD